MFHIELIRPRSVLTDIDKTKIADIITNALKSVVSLKTLISELWSTIFGETAKYKTT